MGCYNIYDRCGHTDCTLVIGFNVHEMVPAPEVKGVTQTEKAAAHTGTQKAHTTTEALQVDGHFCM